MGVAVPNYAAGSTTTDPDKGAEKLFKSAGWIRRLAHEIDDEASLNAFKIYQLCEVCQRFKDEADIWRSGEDYTLVLEALVSLTREAGIGNPDLTTTQIQTAWKSLYTGVETFLSWCVANLPGVDDTISPVTVTVKRTWPRPDLVATTTKAPALSTKIGDLLAEFTEPA